MLVVRYTVSDTSVEKLVAPGGPCEGALVILQEDNAGPHTEANYHR